MSLIAAHGSLARADFAAATCPRHVADRRPRLACASRLRGCDMPPACRWSPLRP